MQFSKTENLLLELVREAIAAGLIEPDDRYFAINRLLACLHLDSVAPELPSLIGGHGDEQAAGRPENDGNRVSPAGHIPELVAGLAEDAVARLVIEDLADKREVFAADLMAVFLDKPSTINRQFWQIAKSSPQKATNWFYRLSQASNYIQTRRIARNISFQAATEFGNLDITINLSKPEKNPRDIAAARKIRSQGYPLCLLCVENEGYAGRIGHPARANHRLIRLTLTGEPWYFQYSPYSYYQEHCIVLSEIHRDMKIDRVAFQRLLEFVTLFPHYFIGSNADLPIVGGSILTHDHFQGGRYEFAMARASEEGLFRLPDWPMIQASVLRWPMSVIRLRSWNPEPLIEAADRILGIWREYSDPEADILAWSGSTPHNTLTPIARRRGRAYEMDLVLRNNRQSEEHPLGIFHPHADVHHIKQENIGLIEVMGLAILPPRLLDELAAVEAFLLEKPADIAGYHKPWAEALRQRYAGQIHAGSVHGIIRQGVTAKFERVLADAGVYKRDPAGQAAFQRLIVRLS